MPCLSSYCHCGPGGSAKHELNKCPHLFHICTEACGPYYRSLIGHGPVALLQQAEACASGTAPFKASVDNGLKSRPPPSNLAIKPPWES